MKRACLGGFLAAGLIALGAVTAATPASAARPASAGASTAASERAGVTVIGVPGLRWEDLSAEATPALWDLASAGSVGALSVRAAVSVTCPADGWATLGAGNRARGPAHGSDCPAQPPEVTSSLLTRVTRANDRLDFGAEIGALGDAVRSAGDCVTTQGNLAALATGALASGGSANLAGEAACPLTVVELPAVAGPAGSNSRRDAVAAVDRQVGAITRALPRDAVVLVAGVSETGGPPPRLHVVIAKGPGFPAGRLLTSPTTRRAPYVQLIDMAPTALRVLGVAAPTSMSGRPMHSEGAARSLADRVASLVDNDDLAQEQRRLVPPFFALLVVGQAMLYLGVAWALHRMRGGGEHRARERQRLLRALRVTATAGAAVLVSTYLANLVPWWRAGHPLAVLLVAVGVATAVVTAAAYAGAWRRWLTGPLAVVTGVTAVVLAADIVSGGHLQLSSLAGYSPLVAGRFAGFGNVAFAVFATGALLFAALLAEGRSRREGVAIVTVIGVAAIAIDGYPNWGDDFGGVLSLIPAFAVLGMLVAGVRITLRRLLAVGVVAVLVVAAFALVDYARPADHQTHLGRFVGQVLHGGAGTVVHRKAQANLDLLTHSVLTLLVPLAIVLLTAVLLRPWGGLRLAFARSPRLRDGLVATLVMSIVGFFVNDSGVAIPALAMTVAIPVAIAAAAEALRRADSLRHTMATEPGSAAEADQVLP